MNLLRKYRSLTSISLAVAIVFAMGSRTCRAQAPGPGGPPRPERSGPENPIVPADTLSSPKTPQKIASADGFLQRWLILEPIPVNGLTQKAVREEVGKQYFPDQMTVIPRDGDKVTAGDAQLTWHAEDTKNYNVDLFRFSRALGKPTSNVLFWTVSIVDAPQEMHDVRLAIGSNAASVWWLNGEEVIGIYGDRQTVIDDGVSKRLTLKKGPNILRAAVVNGGGATDFCARFLDAQDKPIKSLSVNLSKP